MRAASAAASGSVATAWTGGDAWRTTWSGWRGSRRRRSARPPPSATGPRSPAPRRRSAAAAPGEARGPGRALAGIAGGHAGGDVWHSRAARASRLGSSGRSATSTRSQPLPQAVGRRRADRGDCRVAAAVRQARPAACRRAGCGPRQPGRRARGVRASRSPRIGRRSGCRSGWSSAARADPGPPDEAGGAKAAGLTSKSAALPPPTVSTWKPASRAAAAVAAPTACTGKDLSASRPCPPCRTALALVSSRAS